MLKFVISQIRRTPGRTFALAFGVLASSVAFVLLVGSARSGELKVAGSVRSNFRPAYDVLVRPAGSATQLERSQGLVRDNYLSGIYGGITLGQWHKIERLPGVAVAAPIANVGYIDSFDKLSISLDPYLKDAPTQIFRIRSSYATPDGSRYPSTTSYVYVTRNGIFQNDQGAIANGSVGQLDHGRLIRPCSGFTPATSGSSSSFSAFEGRPFAAELFPYITCYSTRSGRPEVLGGYPSRYVKQIQTTLSAAIPLLVAAIDPTQEAKLVGLDHTVVAGRYLRADEEPTIRRYLNTFSHQSEGIRYIPVLAASQTYVGETLETQIDRLRVPAHLDVAAALAAGSCKIALQPCPKEDVSAPPAGDSYRSGLEFVRSLAATTVDHRSIRFSRLYQALLTNSVVSQKDALTSVAYWGVSDVRYRRRPDGTLVPQTTTNPLSAYGSMFGSAGWPWDNKDVQFRRLSERQADNAFDNTTHVLNSPSLHIVGRFDPSKLPGFSPLSKVPLETYYPPLLTAADAASERVLQGRPLSPSQNLGDYIQQPPLLLTTIASLPALLKSQYWHGVPVRERRAPISAIRVRVAGVTGADARSVARIDSVALRIHQLTGLQVDITAGSSPHPLTVALPAGKFGRPALKLTEGWSKKGVSLAFLHGVDRKRLTLFALIPLLCCLFLGNGVFAAARSRRSEIGTLLTLGWSRGTIFRLLLGEIFLVGLAAGVVGLAVVVVLDLLLGLHTSAVAIALVLPSAVALALISGSLPALRASAGTPLDALRPPVAEGNRGSRVHSLLGMAFLNLRRIPGRAALGAVGLSVGACAITVLVAVQRAFDGVLAGTVLGDAISVQIRGLDYLAAALVVGLAALSVADVLYLNLRDRQAELVTLRTLGWRQRHLAHVVVAEAVMLGFAGSTLGALAGAALGTAILHAPVAPVLAGAAAALIGGVLAAVCASLLPLSQLGRLTPPSVLAGEQ
jgi:putative ABC transport system permease protein